MSSAKSCNCDLSHLETSCTVLNTRMKKSRDLLLQNISGITEICTDKNVSLFRWDAAPDEAASSNIEILKLRVDSDVSYQTVSMFCWSRSDDEASYSSSVLEHEPHAQNACSCVGTLQSQSRNPASPCSGTLPCKFTLSTFLRAFFVFLYRDMVRRVSMPTHRKRLNLIHFHLALLLATFIPFSLSLRTGEYPTYDSLCASTGPLVPVMWDCKGYIQCMPLGYGTYRAVWTQCSGGRFYDPDQMACVVQYTKCPAPKDAAMNICPSKPHLKFPHPGSCAMFYDCSQPSNRQGLGPWENECPDPLLFDEATYTCVKRKDGDTQFCGTRPEPNGKCEYRLGCTDKNCTGLVDGPHYDPVAPFTEKFYVCKNRTVVEKKHCEEEGHFFDPIKRDCTDAINDESVQNFCKKNPTAVFPDPSKCSLFYDCSQDSWHPLLKPYQSECAYPRLFDQQTSSCASFLDVTCGRRRETIQPCDYVVGHCVDAGCIPCVASCLGLRDGSNAYPGRVLTSFYLVCQRERTIDIRTCAEGSIFDPQMRTCLMEISSQTLDIYCANNPDGRLLHPSECSMFYSCTQQNNSQVNPNLPARAVECKYPYLVDAGTVTCKPHTLVKCGGRREPYSPCDYVSNRCTSKACTKCELIMPSCYGKADNYYPAINQEMTAHYIICKDQRVMGAGSCPNGTIFDIRTLTCTDVVYPLSLLEFCTNYHTGRVQNPANCAQYYDCAMSLTEVTECTYPDLYDVTSHLCLPYNQVTCAGRPVFLDPCDSFTFCPVQPCPYCNSAYPSCVGRNGAVGGFRFEPSMYYQCVNDRLVLKYCQTTFNWTAKTCNELINPGQTDQSSSTSTTTVRPSNTTLASNDLKANIVNTCKAWAGLIMYKEHNCAQFFNCSNPTSPLGAYIDECPVGYLFNIFTNNCHPYNEVMCQGRYEPEQVCDYQRYCQNKSNDGCSECKKIYPSCQNVSNGMAPAQGGFYYSAVICRSGRAVNVSTCPSGQFYDAVMKKCSPIMSDESAKVICKELPKQIIPHPIYCNKYILCGENVQGNPNHASYTIKECPYPLLFSNGLCRNFKTVSCGQRKTAISPCDYEELRKCPESSTTCKVGTADTCPDKTDHICAPCEKRYPSCIDKPDGFVPYPGRLFTRDFVRCDSGRTLAILKCVQSVFDPNTRSCGLKLDQVIAELKTDPISFCKRYPSALIPDSTHCARFYNCSGSSSSGIDVAHLQECRHPKLFDTNKRICDNFIEVLNTAGCEEKFQPKHYCDYVSICPSQRFKTCNDCRKALPSCINQVNGIHGNPPGQAVTAGFMYCVEGRVLATSPCPQGTSFHQSVKACVQQSNG